MTDPSHPESKTTIYVVEGSTGEYSDHREWLVKAYRSKASAEAKVLRCDERARLLFKHNESNDRYEYNSEKEEAWRRIEESFKDEDPGLQCDYTGANYSIHEVELED